MHPHPPPIEEGASGREEADREDWGGGGEQKVQGAEVQESQVELCQRLEAFWDADKGPGHFYRQTTYFHPPITRED